MSSDHLEAYFKSILEKRKNTLVSKLNNLESDFEKFKTASKERFSEIFSALERGEKTFYVKQPLFQDELEMVKSKYNLVWIKQEKMIEYGYSGGTRPVSHLPIRKDYEFLEPEPEPNLVLTFGPTKKERIIELETELKNLEATPKTVYEPIENVAERYLEKKRQKSLADLQDRIHDEKIKVENTMKKNSSGIEIRRRLVWKNCSFSGSYR